MVRMKFASAFALIVALACVRAHAMAPALPPGSIAPETMVVVHVDAVHLNPDALRTAAKTVLGQNAVKADDGIAKFQEKFDKATAAGVEAITVIVTPVRKAATADAPVDTTRGRNEPNVAMYIKTKAGSDPKAIEKTILDDMNPADRDNAVFEENGQLITMHEKNRPLPTKTDPERARAFADALATIGEASVQVVFIPDAATKEQMIKDSAKEGAPAGLKDAAPLVANAKWITLAVSLSAAPGLTATANLGDAASAKKLADSINAGLDDLKQKAANPGPDAGPMAMFGPLIGQLVEGLRPVTTEGQVAVSLKGAPLTMLASTAIGFMNMGAGAGGPPRPAPQPPQ